jgi:SAM-dependent MidA family methyltransferase
VAGFAAVSAGDGPSDPRGRAFEVVASTIRRNGPIPFAAFVDLALYAPEVGFYEAGGVAGRRGGDFVTSAETGALFGAVLAGALDTWWDALDRPDPYVVVDAGAGPGTLALAVAAAHPRCEPALRYLLVERSAAQRTRHGDHLSLSHPETSRSGVGPHFVSLGELPAGPFAGVVLANELLDNLPFDVYERTETGWGAVHVALDAAGDALVEVIVPVEAAPSDLASTLAPGAPVGARIPVQVAAGAWLRGLLDQLTVGRVVVLDYAATTAGMAERPDAGWLRTYAGHERGSPPLDRPGHQDITAEVAIDQLARVRPPDVDRAQAQFLRAHRIDDLVEEGRRTWTERAAIGDLDALRARSRVTEAEALTDPTGLGAFRVLEWSVGD